MDGRPRFSGLPISLIFYHTHLYPIYVTHRMALFYPLPVHPCCLPRRPTFWMSSMPSSTSSAPAPVALSPQALPAQEPVWRYFHQWRHHGTLDTIHDLLLRKVRTAEKPYHPRTSASVDSQSVDTTSGGEQRGRDNSKNVDGRKRHIVETVWGCCWLYCNGRRRGRRQSGGRTVLQAARPTYGQGRADVCRQQVP